ncbi:MAG: hypothetical protein WCI18_03170 [Pseudomonadota bacterium]
MNVAFFHFLKQRIILLGMIVGLIFTEMAEGAGTDRAWQKFKSGDLLAAKVESAKALKAATSPQQKSEAFKVSGVVAYSLGSKDEARKYFAEAKRYNPSQSIGAGEVFDASVIGFFQSIKPSGQIASSSAKPSGKARQTPSIPTHLAPAPSRAGSRGTSQMAAKPLGAPAQNSGGLQRQSISPQKKGTFIQVLSNVKSATVSIDGILAGSSRDLIQVKAGKVMFEVTAVGYFPAKSVLNVAEGTTAKASVNLRPVNPPKAAAPSPRPKAHMSQSKMPKNNLSSTSKGKQQPKQNGRKVDILGEDPPLAQGARDNLGTSYQPVGTLPVRQMNPSSQFPSSRNQASAARSPNGSPGGSQNASPSPQMQQPFIQQQYPQPYPQQYAPQPYAQQFPTTYPQQYPQPYSQPYGPSPYMNGYPPLGGQQYPPPSSYPSTPIVTVVPIYSGAGAAPAAAYDPYAAPPSPAIEPAPNPFSDSPSSPSSYKRTFDSSSPKKKKKVKKEIPFGLSLLPFGVPQFAGNKPLLGTLFAAGQGGALYMWYKSNSDADNAAKSGQAEITRREADGAGQTNPEAYQADTEAYRATVKKFVDDARLKSYIGLGGFGALWVLSFAESLVYGPATSAALEPMNQTENIASLKDVESTHYWQILPYEKGLSLGVSWNF